MGKAGNAVYYPEDGTAVDFIAYYPYDEQVTDHTQYVLDVTDQSRQQDIDLMAAVNLTGRTATSPTGNLQFRHLLAKLGAESEQCRRQFANGNQSNGAATDKQGYHRPFERE